MVPTVYVHYEWFVARFGLSGSQHMVSNLSRPSSGKGESLHSSLIRV